MNRFLTNLFAISLGIFGLQAEVVLESSIYVEPGEYKVGQGFISFMHDDKNRGLDSIWLNGVPGNDDDETAYAMDTLIYFKGRGEGKEVKKNASLTECTYDVDLFINGVHGEYAPYSGTYKDKCELYKDGQKDIQKSDIFEGNEDTYTVEAFNSEKGRYIVTYNVQAGTERGEPRSKSMNSLHDEL